MNISDGIVHRALDEADVEGLLQLGAPSDEYQPEAEMIANRLRATDAYPSEDAVTAIVADVCREMFGAFDEKQSALRMPTYRRVAKRILELGGG